MFFKHPAFVDPQNSNLKLWRYTQPDKLFHLLESSKLYFCRADYFQKEDVFEGSFPRLEYEYQCKRNNGKETSRRLYQINSKDTFINCWHLSQYESLAMWKLYAKDEKGIAIQTTVADFKDSFENSDRTIYAGKVDYINYDTDTFYKESGHKYLLMNAFSLFIHKRKIYSYENEYRAICRDSQGSKLNGVFIQVNLNKLIHQIFLSPFATEREYKEITNKLEKIKLQIPIRFSSFKAQPYY